MQTMTSQPALLSRRATAERCGISLRHLASLVASGRFGLRPVYLGAKVLFPAADVNAWIAAGCPSRDRWNAMQEAGR